jgi:hypothetical protein
LLIISVLTRSQSAASSLFTMLAMVVPDLLSGLNTILALHHWLVACGSAASTTASASSGVHLCFGQLVLSCSSGLSQRYHHPAMGSTGGSGALVLSAYSQQ